AEGHYSYLYEITTTVEELTGTMMEDGIIFARYTNRQDSQSLGTDIQQNFIGDFSLGSMRNRMVIGLDYYNSRSIDNGSGYGNQGFVYIGSNVGEFQPLAPSLHAFYGTPMGGGADDTGVLTQAGADAGIMALGDPGAQFSEVRQEILSA